MLFNLLLTGDTGTGTGAGTDPAAKGGIDIGTIIMIAVVAVLLIAFFVWQHFSNKKKRKEAQTMMENLQPGVKIKTIGGICGYLVEMNNAENTFVLETGSGEHKCYLKFDKGAIYQTGAAADVPTIPVKEEKKVEAKVEEKVEAVEAPATEVPFEEIAEEKTEVF